MFKRSFGIAMAFIGVLAGASFASGREALLIGRRSRDDVMLHALLGKLRSDDIQITGELREHEHLLA